MPPRNPPSSRHAGALDAKIHKLDFGFGQYEFWPRPPLACRAADKAGTHRPADCNVSAFSFVPFCSPSRPFLHTVMPAAEPAPCEAMARMMAALVETLRAASPTVAGNCKRLTRYACTPFLSTAKEREERMPPLNPPASRHAGASDKAGTHHPTDCNVRAGGFAQRRMAKTLRAAAPAWIFPPTQNNPPENLEFLKNIITFAAITKQT